MTTHACSEPLHLLTTARQSLPPGFLGKVADDNRLPGKECPYRLDPRGDPEFFALARKFRAMHRTPVREWISFYVITLLTHMDEKLVGQTEALHAYEAGATPDNPPWIHTTFP